MSFNFKKNLAGKTVYRIKEFIEDRRSNQEITFDVHGTVAFPLGILQVSSNLVVIGKFP